MFNSKKKSKAGKKKPDDAKLVQVKVRIPFTTVSFTSVLLIGLLTLIGYSGYLGVKSIWEFTHPKFNVSFDSFRALPYIASGTEIPPIPALPFPIDRTPTTSAQVDYIQAVGEFKEEFRRDFPKSRLLNISDNEFLNMGLAFCETKNESITKTGKFTPEEIILAYQAKFVLRYPGMNGLNEFLAGVGQRALDNLCRSS
jgi:hypothetical protein